MDEATARLLLDAQRVLDEGQRAIDRSREARAAAAEIVEPTNVELVQELAEIQTKGFEQLGQQVAALHKAMDAVERSQRVPVESGPAQNVARGKSRRGRKKGSLEETRRLNAGIIRAKDAIARKGGDASSTKEIVAHLAADRAIVPLPAGWRSQYGVKSWGEVLEKPELLKLAGKRFTKVKPRSL